MLLPELQSMASSLGISGTGRMRRGELIAAIQERRGGEGRVPGPRHTDAHGEVASRVEAPPREVRADVGEPAEVVRPSGAETQQPAEVERREPAGDANGGRTSRRASRPGGPPESRNDAPRSDAPRGDSPRGDSRPEGRTEVEERPARKQNGPPDPPRRDTRR